MKLTMQQVNEKAVEMKRICMRISDDQNRDVYGCVTWSGKIVIDMDKDEMMPNDVAWFFLA